MAKQVASMSVAGFVALVCSVMLVAPSHAVPASNRPDPWYKQPLPTQPRPGYYQHLGDCIDVLTKPCGLQIFDYIYGVAPIDIPCCKKMAAMGQLCSKSLSLTLGQIAKYKKNAALIRIKSDEAYDKCVKIAGKVGSNQD